MPKCRFSYEGTGCRVSDYLRDYETYQLICEGDLKFCVYASKYPGLKKMVAEDFVKNLDLMLKVGESDKGDFISQMVGKFFGEHGAPKTPLEVQTFMQHLDEESEKISENPIYRGVIAADIVDLLYEWIDAFARFEPPS